MNESDQEKENKLDVKFYPIKNRYLERSVLGLSRLMKLILFFLFIIFVVVTVDFLGYAFEDIKKLYSGDSPSGIVEGVENIINEEASQFKNSGLYAGHSLSADSISQMHTIESIKSMFNNDSSDTNTSDTGYFGIDVSHWQQTINWEQVEKDTIPHKIEFSIVKATQGASQVDSYFKVNWQKSNDLLELSGAYHYYIHSDDPKKQADNFINNVTLSSDNFPPILDIELSCANCDTLDVPVDTLIADLKIYVEEIENHYNLKPLIYTNLTFYNNYLSGHFDEYMFWMASYSKSPPSGLVGVTPEQTGTNENPNIVMWQFSDYEKINGVTGNVDMNFLPKEGRTSIESAAGR